MYTILIFLFVLVAILMTITILMQSSKGGGLAASFGGLGSSGVLGPRSAASFLQKATTILATLYLLLCLIIGWVGRPSEGARQSVIQREMQKEQQQQQAAPLPVAPMNPQQTQPTQTPQK